MQDKEPDEFRESAAIKHIWLLFRQDRIALFSFYLFIVFILTALFSPWIAPYSSDMQFVGQELLPPSWTNEGKISFSSVLMILAEMFLVVSLSVLAIHSVPLSLLCVSLS